jgi:hypothetical protein
MKHVTAEEYRQIEEADREYRRTHKRCPWCFGGIDVRRRWFLLPGWCRYCGGTGQLIVRSDSPETST